MTIIWNFLSSLYPLFARFINIDLAKQNWWNENDAGEIFAKKVKTEEVHAIIDVKVKVVQPKYCWPHKKMVITSPFGNRTLTYNGKKHNNFHTGIDCYGKRLPRNVTAPEDLIIKKVLLPDTRYPSKFKWVHGKGWIKVKVPKGRAWTPYCIAIGVHSKTKYSFYHFKIKPELKVGSEVKAGQYIGKFGQWGFCMGAHDHFQTSKRSIGKYVLVNPTKFLGKKIARYEKNLALQEKSSTYKEGINGIDNN